MPTTVTTDFFGASTNDPVLYDRIEVVRGSTGLLTGAGNPSASVNLVRKHADSKVFAGSASLALKRSQPAAAPTEIKLFDCYGR